MRSIYARVPRRDKVIQGTDMDAMSSKYWAVSKGYLTDEYMQGYVQEFQTRYPRELASALSNPKLPLINRGTYARVTAIDDLLADILGPGDGNPKQIVSLGAGSDTRPFKYLKQYPKLVYHEIDFEVSTIKKRDIIMDTGSLRDIIGNETGTETGEIHTDRYHLHALDLRDIGKPLQGIDFTKETIVISECCLCYLEPEKSQNVIDWCVKSFDKLSILMYEPIGRNDSFGNVMIENLASRGISLPNLNKFPSLDSQVDRLKQSGLSQAYAADIYYIYEHWIPEQEKARIEKLEFLDELEELKLLLQHYCVVWGSYKTLEFPHNDTTT